MSVAPVTEVSDPRMKAPRATTDSRSASSGAALSASIEAAPEAPSA